MDELKRTYDRPITRITQPLKKFLHIESAGGLVLLVATAVALAAANTDLRFAYLEFWNMILSLKIGDWELSYPLWYWVNDGLMTVFFFLVGLEIKREIVSGELREFRSIISPAAAAVGGAAVPAIIYVLLLGDASGKQGWAVPMATDIAFVVGALAILGKRVPHALKIFILALAIVDDIIAVLVIALFFSSKLYLTWLVAAIAGFLIVVFMNRLGVRSVFGYLIIGSIVWFCTLKSGIHPTVSGVVLGILTPAVPLVSRGQLTDRLKKSLNIIGNRELSDEDEQFKEITNDIVFTTRESVSPLERFESDIHPWAAFAIMPVFAMANAGVSFSADALSSTVSIAIAIALLIGKPLGIVLSLFIIVKARLGVMPEGTGWITVVGGGCLAGIGFTMSLFVASLGLEGVLLTQAKSGILVGSAASGILGMTLLAVSLRRKSVN